MPSPIKTALRSWLADWLPMKSQKSFFNPRSEPTFVANLIDVDSLRGILAASESGNVRDLFGLYRDIILSDSHLQAEFHKRKLAVLGDTVSIQPVDKKNPDDVKAAQAIEYLVSSVPDFLGACSHLLDSTLYPVALVEKVYRTSSRPGLRFELDKLVVVPHLDLDYSTAFMRLWKLDPASGYINGTLEVVDPNRYITHRGHLLKMPDYWGGPMRSLLFWWLMGSMGRDWWARFLERFGAPFMLGKYDPSDDAARSILQQAFQAATKLFGVVVSTETEVELVQAMTSQTGEAFEKFKTFANDQVSTLILGQTGSTKQSTSGLNSSGNKQHESVRQDIRQYDQLALSDTLRQQLFRPYLDWNGIPGATPKMVWGGVSQEEQTALGTLMLNLFQAGYSLTDDGLEALSEKIAFPLQRSTPPAGSPTSMPSNTPFSILAAPAPVTAGHALIDRIAANGAADLSQAFRGSLAPVRRIILESRSSSECEARLREFYADWNPAKLSALTEEALIAYAANGAVSRAAAPKA
jgi:phage gp29-like protein